MGAKKILNIHTDDLKASAPTYNKQANKLFEATTELQRKLAALGEPWGGDEQGRAFHTHYKKGTRPVEKALPILIMGLQSIHLAMSDMADGHIANEGLIVGMFKPKEDQEPPENPVKPEFR
ncbi:hypothetical protein [Streptomyces sp. 3N207]|uniref:hypothetical protein n=1 Tax=Streptomyces sp. 3N207 TaxID=3457417 RepID=UPI003FD21900